MQTQSGMLQQPCRRWLMQLSMRYCAQAYVGTWMAIMQASAEPAWARQRGNKLRRRWRRRRRARPSRGCTPWLLLSRPAKKVRQVSTSRWHTVPPCPALPCAVTCALSLLQSLTGVEAGDVPPIINGQIHTAGLWLEFEPTAQPGGGSAPSPLLWFQFWTSVELSVLKSYHRNYMVSPARWSRKRLMTLKCQEILLSAGSAGCVRASLPEIGPWAQGYAYGERLEV